MLLMIAAIGKNRELGRNNSLIWNLPNDLKFFKERTMNKTVVMGKNTFNSLPRLLPGRKHVVLSDDDDFNKDTTDVLVYKNKESLISYVNELAKNEDVYIIGGASMYTMFVNLCDSMVLTEINDEALDADVYYPYFNPEDWNVEIISQGSDGNISYIHRQYTK